ncbi:MAG: MMPL family transporter [Streptosporangiaceae bacterium]|nr:MMPL family transporter [Streptosporangiaceae bacterium]
MLARAYAFAVVSLRWPVIGGWIAALVLAVLFLPTLSSAGGLSPSGLAGLVPSGSAGAHADADATRLFGFPLDPAVAVVQRNPHGMAAAVTERSVRAAVAVDRGRAGPDPVPGLSFAVPLPNTAGLLPGTAEQSTTVVTFLTFRPGVSIAGQTADGTSYAHRFLGRPSDSVVGVTGLVPARYSQGLIITRYLGWVELFTVLAIAVIVGARFRSAGAPLVALACAGIAYELSVRIVAWAAQRAGVSLPPDLEPVLVVLLLGVTTDYSVFFLAGMRGRLAAGEPRVRAARLATGEFAPIIFAAGLVVAAGTGSMYAARSTLLRAFGPGLALTVLTAMAVSMTLCPALMAVFGRLLFRNVTRRERDVSERDLRVVAARVAAARPVALILAGACVVGLVVAAFGARELRSGSPLIHELPSSSSVVKASAAASSGFAPGILSPTEILLIRPGITGVSSASSLSRLEGLLNRQPGVAAVAGPTNLPSALAPVNPMLAKSGNAVRFAVVLRSDPLDAAAISDVRALQGRLPALGRAAGLPAGVRFEVGGETALTADAITATVGDLWRIALAIMVATLVLLAIFLRALLAPLYLLAASVLAVLAALGLTALICQALFGSASLVYYVPFAAGVLLVALGSDYNVFVVGRIWEEARRRPVPDAVALAAPRASRAITTAAVALAASFALLAVIPLLQFRQIAITMAIGVLLDAIVVRSLLVPALVALFGRAGMWPGNRVRAARGQIVADRDMATMDR